MGEKKLFFEKKKKMFVLSLFLIFILVSFVSSQENDTSTDVDPEMRPNAQVCEQFFDIVTSQFVEPDSRDDADSCFNFGKGTRFDSFERVSINWHLFIQISLHNKSRLLCNWETHPPLFDLNQESISEELRDTIMTTNCDDALPKSLNQLFQKSSRCADDIHHLVPLFCDTSECYRTKNDLKENPFWCEKQSACNILLDSYGQFCVNYPNTEDGLDVWRGAFKQLHPQLNQCELEPDELIYTEVARISMPRGWEIQINAKVDELPDVVDNSGFRCNAGSVDCACLIPNTMGGVKHGSGAGGLCAEGLKCVLGVCYAPNDPEYGEFRVSSSHALIVNSAAVLSAMMLSFFLNFNKTKFKNSKK